MPETTAVRVAYFAAGAAVVAAIAAAVSVSGLFKVRGSGDDEERPPIIVRGGSIIFESGDPTGAEEDKKGKPWMRVKDAHWQPNHPHGIPIMKFTISIEAETPSAACPTFDRTTELSVTYRDDNGVDSVFLIATRASKSAGGNGKQEPTIIGAGLQQGGTVDNPQLTFGTGGTITELRYLGIGGYVDCPRPKRVKIWQE